MGFGLVLLARVRLCILEKGCLPVCQIIIERDQPNGALSYGKPSE